MELSFKKNYQNNDVLRASFNQLAVEIFGIEFEDWYKQGYWTVKYQPYSYIENNRVVANVSASLITLLINGEEKRAVQIGTVMTDPDYRNRGLSKRLMDKVLDDYKEVDLIYLFANQSVLDFYPKFGFKVVEEVQFSLNYKGKPSKRSEIKKLDGRKHDDLAMIYQIVSNQLPGSSAFDTIECEELLMFYSLYVFPCDIYYLEKEETIVIFQGEGSIVNLYAVISQKEVDVKDVLERITSEDTTKIFFHYHPGEIGLPLEKQSYKSNNILFVKNITGCALPAELKHPITAQA